MENLSYNLKLMCDQYASIAHVCREIEINRQQFNRYLNGETRPSAHSLRRIAGFFAIPATDLDLEPQVFARRHSTGRNHTLPEMGLSSNDAIAKADRYCGWYHTYYRCTGYHKAIIRGFVKIYQDGDVTRSKVLDRYYWRHCPRSKTTPIVYYKMNGVVTQTGGFLYLLDSHKGLNANYTMTCLYSSYSDHIDMLNGVMIGVSNYLDRRPFASNIAYVAVDRAMSLRDAVRQCGIYPEDAKEIPKVIRTLVRNRVNRDVGVLMATGLS